MRTNEYERTVPEAVVLANGDYPSASHPLEVLRQAPYVVCCDGAANEYIRRGNLPDMIVGDGDSLSPGIRERYADRVLRVADQETNDQTKAVRFLLGQGKRRIAIVGATGKREDHTLGNISLLIDYMRAGAEVSLYTDHCLILPCRDTRTLDCTPGAQVSIINFGARGIHGEGLAYPLRDFTNWWQGTLNECTGSQFTIEAEGEYLLILPY